MSLSHSQVSDAGGRFEVIGVGNSLKGAVALRRGLLGTSTIVHRFREILLEDAGNRGLAASNLGSNTLLTHALGSEGKITPVFTMTSAGCRPDVVKSAAWRELEIILRKYIIL